MNTAENRRIVADGLEHRKVLRMEAEKEARQEQFEADMILACNANYASAKDRRERREQIAMRRQEIARARAKAFEQECKATNAVRMYGILCLVVLLVCSVTRLPLWAAITLIMGGTVFPAAYIYRLYVPFEE